MAGMKDKLFCLSSSFAKRKLSLFMSSAGGSSNGRTTAFEAVNFGSIPSPPAEDGNRQ